MSKIKYDEDSVSYSDPVKIDDRVDRGVDGANVIECIQKKMRGETAERVAEALLGRAMAGDMDALKLAMNYVYGLPGRSAVIKDVEDRDLEGIKELAKQMGIINE